MKNITLSADELLIEQARKVAQARNTSLNTLFREWLSTLVDQKEREKQLKDIHQRLHYAHAGGNFSREEMNAR